jgi:hypothetical protein
MTVTGLRVSSADALFLLWVVLLQVWEERTKNRFELKYLQAQLQWLEMPTFASGPAPISQQLRLKSAPDGDSAIKPITP